MKKIFFVAFTGFALLGSGAVMAKADATLIKEATKNVVTVSSKNFR